MKSAIITLEFKKIKTKYISKTIIIDYVILVL